jgi:hypothetical protein
MRQPISQLRQQLKSKHSVETMNKYQGFQSAARENGYAESNECGGGSAIWFRKAAPDQGTEVHKRLCIDSLTGSATVFWQTVPARLNSKTFRTVSSLKDWFDSTPEG